MSGHISRWLKEILLLTFFFPFSNAFNWLSNLPCVYVLQVHLNKKVKFWWSVQSPKKLSFHSTSITWHHDPNKHVSDIFESGWNHIEDVWGRLPEQGLKLTRCVSQTQAPLCVWFWHAYTHLLTSWRSCQSTPVMGGGVNHSLRRLFDLNKCCLKISEEGADGGEPGGSSVCLTWMCHEFEMVTGEVSTCVMTNAFNTQLSFVTRLL